MRILKDTSKKFPRSMSATATIVVQISTKKPQSRL